MEAFLNTLKSLVEHATFNRALSIGLLVIFLLVGYIGYQQAPTIGNYFSGNRPTPPFIHLPPESEVAISNFMKKHSEVGYLTVLTLQFEKNIRLPIYRAFNSDELSKFIYDKLKGGDGALPIFIKEDTSNNSQMISIITGETICSPFGAGGLSRSIPESIPKFHTSCRTPLPPVFGDTIRGYIVVHINGKERTPYEIEVLKLDLAILSKLLHEQTN